MRLSSALERDSLDLLGLWRSLPDAITSIDVLAEAAADGWFWWLTPATEVRFVHAVPRPVEAPRPTVLIPFRTLNSTEVALIGGVDLHGPSTERLDVEAAWSEWVDDLAKPAPTRIDVVAAAADTRVNYDEDLVILSGQDQELSFPDGTLLRLHKAVHQLGDTKHRNIDYRMRATTRYREYFDPRVVPTRDDDSVLVLSSSSMFRALRGRRSRSFETCCRCSDGSRRPSPSSPSVCVAAGGWDCASISIGRGIRRATVSFSAWCWRSAAMQRPRTMSASGVPTRCCCNRARRTERCCR
jgi:hypothetical protein